MIAAKAVPCGSPRARPSAPASARATANAKVFAEALQAGGVPVLTGDTDVHLVLVDLAWPAGRQGGRGAAGEVGITVTATPSPSTSADRWTPGAGHRHPRRRRAAWSRTTWEIAEVIAVAVPMTFQAEGRASPAHQGPSRLRYPLYPQLSAAAV